ncbi:helix-turn-helix domain-containing protein [Cupriavidus basilensis]|uniref:Helix-turn-helix domain-containing protein n=1 Tax=Cupriavidus basilensis TaxID=68895 RepID=A0ABT6AHL1_9BURK|nr:helix-turn-helix domain-containing protein [Cupriavidus basilensis]MDF3832096.1 helix-turn-helix domain-containing protein [Cupriavidus basilensis]
MWLDPDRVLYVGLLGAPSVRAIGAILLYVALDAPFRLSVADGAWETAEIAMVPPYAPHRIVSDSRTLCGFLIEPETVDMSRLPPLLRGPGGALAAPRQAQHARDLIAQLRGMRRPALDPCLLDTLMLGGPLAPRTLDPRIDAAVRQIKGEPGGRSAATDHAREANLSFSRFLHLFKAEIGTPFRTFRTWKRARSLLHYVTQEANLADVALDTGYPDSTHFSHSIRRVYGLKPRDIFAGSRRLALHGMPRTAAYQAA